MVFGEVSERVRVISSLLFLTVAVERLYAEKSFPTHAPDPCVSRSRAVVSVSVSVSCALEKDQSGECVTVGDNTGTTGMSVGISLNLHR